MTIGWVYEDAYERWGDSQSSPRLRPLPNFVCSLCSARFQTVHHLTKHQTENHRVRLPGFYVGGVVATRDLVIREHVQLPDIHLVNCDVCRVSINGDAWVELSTREFAERFVEVRDEDWLVRLSRDSQVSSENPDLEFRIHFRISSEEELEAVDEIYRAILVRDELTHRDLTDFNRRLPAAKGAREYGEALCDYALGVMIKERRVTVGSPVAFDEYAIKMRSALAILSRIRRPVSDLVCFVIRLNLNDFSHSSVPIGTSLESAFRLLNTAAGHGPPETPLRQSKVSSAGCPLDWVTGELAAACERLACGEHVADALERLLRDAVVSAHDRVKIHTICAVDLSRRDRSRALHHLKHVEFDHSFSKWATEQLGTGVTSS